MARVITERDVRAAAAQGCFRLPERAIVTPAAHDLARRLGVVLEKGEQGAEGGEQVGRPAFRSPLPAPRRTVTIGSDHGGFALKSALKPVIAELGFEVLDVGCENADSVDYPVFAARVAERVSSGETRFGIVVDGAGIGSAMVANKISGVRAALCYDLTTARNAREHNNANVLTLGGTLIGERLGGEIVRTFLTTQFAGGRHQRRVAMIDALDGERRTGGRERTG